MSAVFRGLSYATVLVEDQQRALEFYTETLEFVVRDDFTLPDGGRWLAVSPPDEPFPRLALVPADRDHPRLPPDDPDRRHERVGSQVGEYVAFVFSVDDCERAVDRLRERGVEVVADPAETPWGVEAAFRDPWGNVYEVVEPATD